MLTLKAPLEISARTEYINDYDGFGKRIEAGYSLMSSHIESGDLLHVANTPPEVYIAESEGMTSILSQATQNNTNYEKVEIINNLMNRIIMSADVNLTYQDRVFITDALYKLGIRDDRKFMSTFMKFVEDNKDKNRVINMFLSGSSNVENIRNMITDIVNNTEKNESEYLQIEENKLSNQIFERLQTGAVYQIVSNFNRTTENTEINADEYSMTEQNLLSSNILMQKIDEYMYV